MTEEEYNTAKVYVKKGDLDKDNNYPITVKVTGQTNQKVFVTIKDADENIVITYKGEGNKDAQDCTFNALLNGNKTYSVEVIVNKGMENEYRYNDGVSVGNKYVDTDGDSYYDFEDRYPYTKAFMFNSYEKVKSLNYSPDFLNLWSVKDESEKNYNKGEYSKEELDKIVVIATTFATGGVFMNAGEALSNYLSNTGDDMILDMESLLKSSSGKNHFDKNIADIKSHIEDVLTEGNTLYIGSTYPLKVHNVNREPHEFLEFDWEGTIGTSECGALIVKVRLEDSKYFMEYTYSIADFYDWEKDSTKSFIGWVKDGDMFKLHHAGIAKHFYQYGIYKGNLIWKS